MYLKAQHKLHQFNDMWCLVSLRAAWQLLRLCHCTWQHRQAAVMLEQGLSLLHSSALDQQRPMCCIVSAASRSTTALALHLKLAVHNASAGYRHLGVEPAVGRLPGAAGTLPPRPRLAGGGGPLQVGLVCSSGSSHSGRGGFGSYSGSKLQLACHIGY